MDPGRAPAAGFQAYEEVLAVTLAVLCASTGNALGPADAARLADDLTAALGAAGAAVVERPASAGPADQLRAIARLARTADEPMLICADDLVASPGLLWTLATDPAARSTALVVPDDHGDLRDDRGKLVAATDGSTRFAGAICIARGDLALLADTADRAARGPEAGGAVVTDVRDAVDALLFALLDAGLVPVATPTRLLYAERVRTSAELSRARAAVGAVDEDAARLRMAVKEKDDFFTTYAVSSWSPLVTKWCVRLGMTPTGVTAVSVLFAVAAALAFWQASRPAMIAGAVLLYLGFVLDCVDGQVARYTRRFDPFGGWLDTMADRAKEYAVYAGLAAGADRIGLPYAWPLAIAAILLQTVRHMTDAWYGALHDEAATRPTAEQTGVGARLSAASNRVQAATGSPAYWLKRIVVFPIGERWALIAVLAAVFNGRVALAGVLIWGLLAFAYTLGLRSLRSISMRVGVLDTVDTSRHRDDGPLVRAVLSRVRARAPFVFALVAALTALALVIFPGRPLLIGTALVALAAGLPAARPHRAPLDWLVPAALRATEYLFVAAVGRLGDVPPPVIFALLFALALHHYDLVARMEKGAPTGSGGGDPLGWDGRIVLLTVAALAGVATLGEAVLAVLVAGNFLIRAIADRRRAGKAR
jgi:phosphatidylglycerophosphate synthase